MNSVFISVTLVFLVFLIISYYLKIIRLSAPLGLIYLVFCFSYFINDDLDYDDIENGVDQNFQNKVHVEDSTFLDNKNNLGDIVKNREIKNNRLKDISKPVVSSNPKPIIIDSNLIIKEEIGIKSSVDIKKDKINLLPDNEKDVPKLNTLALKEIMICRGV